MGGEAHAELTGEQLTRAQQSGVRHEVRKGAADTAAYVAGSLAYKLIAFLAVPVLARLLSPAELGLLDLAVVVAGMVAIIAGAGMDHAVVRFEGVYPAGQLWLTAIVALGATGAAILLLAMAVTPAASTLIVGDISGTALLSLAAGYGIAMAMVTTAMNVVRLHAGARRYAIIAFGILALEMATAIVLALGGFSVEVILLAWILLSVSASIAIGALHLPRLSSIDWVLLRRLLVFGIPLVPAAVAWHVGEVGIRMVIAGSGDLAGLGAYGIAHRITNVLAIVVAGFSLAWQPLVYRAAAGQQPIIAARGVTTVTAVIAIGALGVSSVAAELVAVIGGPGYARGANVVAVLGLAAVFSGSFAMLTVLAGLAMRTLVVAGVALPGVVGQVFGATVLVPLAGLPGAAIASLSGYAISALLLFAVLRWTGSTSAPIRPLAAAALASVALGALAALGADAPLLVRIPVAAVSALLIGAVALGDGRSLLSLWRQRPPGFGRT